MSEVEKVRHLESVPKSLLHVLDPVDEFSDLQDTEVCGVEEDFFFASISASFDKSAVPDSLGCPTLHAVECVLQELKRLTAFFVLPATSPDSLGDGVVRLVATALSTSLNR